MGENNDPSNLIILCRRCHLITHLKFERFGEIVSEGKFFENELMKFTMRFLKWRYIYKRTRILPPLLCSFIWEDTVNHKGYTIYIAPQDSKNRKSFENYLVKRGFLKL